jgi:hypothetical protein
MRYYEDGQGFGMIPDGFDPSREVPETADRDSGSPARLAALFRDMDVLVGAFRDGRHSEAFVAAQASLLWQEIRQEMGK